MPALLLWQGGHCLAASPFIESGIGAGIARWQTMVNLLACGAALAAWLLLFHKSGTSAAFAKRSPEDTCLQAERYREGTAVQESGLASVLLAHRASIAVVCPTKRSTCQSMQLGLDVSFSFFLTWGKKEKDRSMVRFENQGTEFKQEYTSSI